MAQITLITGASSGIGMALAPLFAADGQKIALVARRTELLEELAEKIKSQGGDAMTFGCDVGDRDAVKECFDRCRTDFGPVHRLIANAGIGDSTPARKFNAETVERITRVNYLGTVYCIEQVLPHMIEAQAGHIVGISSLASFVGMPGSGAYCASKSAMSTLLESLRVELQNHKVKVSTICPGFIRTPLTDRNKFKMPFLMELDDAARKMHNAISREIPLYAFPWALATPVRLAACLPAGIYDKILSGKEARKQSENR